jgi:CBS domain-containing protein
MTESDETAKDYAKKALGLALREQAGAGDESRLQIHLFALEAKRRWNEIEARVRHIEARIALGDGTPDGREERELSRAIRDILVEQGVDAPSNGPVSSIMNPEVRTCRADESLARAVELLKETHSSTLPVVNDAGKLIGVLSEREICLALYESGAPLADTPIATALSSHVCSALAHEPIGRAAETMRQHKRHEIPVTEPDGRVVGTLSLSDIARPRHVDSDEPASEDPSWIAATLIDIYAA